MTTMYRRCQREGVFGLVLATQASGDFSSQTTQSLASTSSTTYQSRINGFRFCGESFQFSMASEAAL